MKRLLLTAMLLFGCVSVEAAVRTKTVQYAFPISTEEIAAGTVRNMTNLDVYIPEMANRKFTSVASYVVMIDSQAAAGSPTAIAFGLGFDALAMTTTTVSDTITNSGEHQSYVFITDHTNQFAGQFLGSSHTVRMAVVLSTVRNNNCSVKLIISYEFNDSETTRLKTVYIPIQSSTAPLPTTLYQLGNGLTSQVPALNTFLPEQSKVYRDIFFEMHVNEGTSAADAVDDPILALSLDADAEVPDGGHQDTLNSARAYYRIWKRTDMDTSVAHTINARTSLATMPFTGLGGVLIVTYQYNHSASSEIVNSIMVPAGESTLYMAGQTESEQGRYEFKFTVPETGPITLLQSGIETWFVDSGVMTIGLSAGSQSVSTYTFTDENYDGGLTVYHRIDNGSGFSIARGTNTLVFDAYRTGTTAGTLVTAFSALAYINYKSSNSVMGGGDANYSHSVFKLIKNYSADGVFQRTTSTAPVINETNYWLTAALWQATNINRIGTNHAYAIDAETLSTDSIGDGYAPLYSGVYNSDAEIGFHTYNGGNRFASFFKRFTSDFETDRVDIESSRQYTLGSLQLTYMTLGLWYTYHSTTFTITGTVSGYAGDGSGIIVDIYNSSTEEKVATATTSAGGTFSAIVYDDTVHLYGVAREDATHKGRSENVIPSTTAMDISFSSGGTNNTGSAAIGY